jgi:hypothetical protein
MEVNIKSCDCCALPHWCLQLSLSSHIQHITNKILRFFITQNLQKNLHKHKNLQSKKHHFGSSQITKEGFEITKLGFYIQSTN